MICAVILAGGMGTRLQSVVKDLPKPMAPLNGRPFLELILNSLYKSKVVSKIILCVGYKRELIQSYFGNKFKSIPIEYSIEESPLGTGGAVLNSISLINDDSFLLINGDTIFDINYLDLVNWHIDSSADITLATKIMDNTSRYGTIQRKDSRIIKFNEKKEAAEGEINGGVYMVNKSVLERFSIGNKFSFEHEILEAMVNDINIQCRSFNGYFIDIGIPEDYSRAQFELT